VCEGCFDLMWDLSCLESVRGFEVEALEGRFALSLRDRRSLLLLSFDEPREEENGGCEQEEVIHDGSLSRWPPSRHVGASTLLNLGGRQSESVQRNVDHCRRNAGESGDVGGIDAVDVVIVRTMK
jgi:hypothetical protein